MLQLPNSKIADPLNNKNKHQDKKPQPDISLASAHLSCLSLLHFFVPPLRFRTYSITGFFRKPENFLKLL